MTRSNIFPTKGQDAAGDDPPLFTWGSTVATPAVLTHLHEHGLPAQSILRRHQRGDWGELATDDQRANDNALRTGARLLSAYTVGGARMWVITEAADDAGVRASTCILFPEEY